MGKYSGFDYQQALAIITQIKSDTASESNFKIGEIETFEKGSKNCFNALENLNSPGHYDISAFFALIYFSFYIGESEELLFTFKMGTTDCRIEGSITEFKEGDLKKFKNLKPVPTAPKPSWQDAISAIITIIKELKNN